MAKSKAFLEENLAAKEHVYANGGNGPCPYPDGSRQARLWRKWRNFYQRMESQFDDLAAAYGEFRPDRLAQKEGCNG